MLQQKCFICWKPLPDNSTCSGDNFNTKISLKSVLNLLKISYTSFVGDFHEGEDSAIFNDACLFCEHCCNLIDLFEDLGKSMVVVKQKFVDRVAAGYRRRRRSTENADPRAKVSDQAADRLGQCFTRSTVVIRQEDAIPPEKLKSLENMEIVQPKQETEELIILDDGVDAFSDGFEPEEVTKYDEDHETGPPVERRKGRPLKSDPSEERLKVADQKKQAHDVAIRTQDTRTKQNNDILERSAESPAPESLQDGGSSGNSDSSSECETEVASALKKKKRQKNDRADRKAIYRKSQGGSTRFRCGKCTTTWTILSHLDRHVKNEHNRLSLLDRPFGCAICPATFRAFEDLKKHVIHYTIAKGHKEYCLLCDFSDDVPVLTGHYFKEHGLDFFKGKYFGCVQCLRAFEPTEESNRSGFVGSDDLPAFKSYAEKHRCCSSPEELTVSQKCRICPETRLTAAELISHESTHFPGVHCALCDFEFKTECTLEAHNRIFHNNILYITKGKKKEVKPRLPNQSSLRTSRCIVCGKWFSNKEELAAHRMTHEAEKNIDRGKGPQLSYHQAVEDQCLMCGHEVPRLHLMNHHTTSIHNLELFRQFDDPFYSCFVCLAPFEPNDPMELPGRLLLKDKEKFLKFAAEHAVCNREPVSEFTCTQCEARFAKPKLLFKHMLGSHSQQAGKKYPCKLCESEFESNIEYLYHLRQQHSEKIKLKCQCYRCCKQFKDVETLQAHILENSEQLECQGCDQNFNGLESYQNHKCNLDQIPEPKEVTSTEVPAHCFQLNGGFSCLPCKKTFDSVALLSLHFQEHHDKAEELNFNCNICSTTLTGSETLQKTGDETFYSTNDNFEHADFTSLCAQHWKTCIANQDETSCSEIEEPLFECYICHQNQDSPQSLAAHLNEHHGVSETYRCLGCSSIFSMLKMLEAHLSSSHNLNRRGSDQHFCRICWEPFHSTDPAMKLGGVAEQDMLHFQTFLDRHFQCKSDKIKPKCGLCSLEIASVRILLSHDVSVHSKQHLKHYCERCGKGFPGGWHLNKHIQSHEMEDGKREKPTCQICGKTFKESRYLEQHLMSHDKQPPFVCQYCGKGFSVKGNLARHEKNHVAVKPTEATVPCPICGKLFVTQRYMKYHVDFTHEKRLKRKKPERKSAKEQPT